MTDLEQQWLDRMKVTIAVELTRGMAQGRPPKALVDMLMAIPEVSQAFRDAG